MRRSPQKTLPGIYPRRLVPLVASLVVFFAPTLVLGQDKSPDLADLTLEDLLQVNVSSASRYSQPTSEAPASVTVISEEELRKHGYRNLAEALVTVPGVYASNDRNYTFLGARGFNRPGDYGTRILLLTDGARRNDPLYDQAMLGNESPIEIDWVKRLEFVSGPASSIYGANALFGTVNTVMLNGGDVNGARVTLDAGSFNSRRLGVVAGQRLEGDRDWFIGFAAYRSKGDDLYFREFDNGVTDGHARGLDDEAYQKVYAKYRWGNWRLSGNFSARRKDLATAPYDTSFGLKGTLTRDDSSLVELRYDGEDRDGWQPSFRIYNGTYRFTGDYNYAALPADNSRDKARADWTGTEIQLAYSGIAQHRILFGIDAQWNRRLEQRYYEVNSGNAILDTNDPSRNIALFVQDEWRFHADWLLNVSLRHDKHSQFSGITSPRAALIWQTTPRLNLKFMAASAYRAPNAYERFYNDNGVSQQANPSLDPERIRSLEFAAGYRIGQGGRIGMSLYKNQMQDLIDQTTDGTGVSSFTNQEKVKARGIELDAENRWENGLRLRGSVAWQQSEHEDGTTLIDSPKRMGKLIGSMPIAHGWTAAGELLGLSSRNGINGPVSGYGIANFSVMSPAIPRYGQFRLSIYNLGDRRYYDPTSSSLTQSRMEQDGRVFRLNWSLAL